MDLGVNNMNSYEQLADLLNRFSIPFSIVEHPPAHTTEEADNYIKGHEGVRTKTLFLNNRHKTAFYLIIMDDTKRLNIEKFKQITGEKKLSFASDESLIKKLGLPAGIVSPFGLINDKDKDIKVYFDKEVTNQEILTFHPNVNTKTIFLKTTDVMKFINLIGFEYSIIDL